MKISKYLKKKTLLQRHQNIILQELDLSKLICTEQTKVIPSYSPSEKNLKFYKCGLQATPKIARAKNVFVLSSTKFDPLDLKPILSEPV